MQNFRGHDAYLTARARHSKYQATGSVVETALIDSDRVCTIFNYKEGCLGKASFTSKRIAPAALI